MCRLGQLLARGQPLKRLPIRLREETNQMKRSYRCRLCRGKTLRPFVSLVYNVQGIFSFVLRS